MTYKEYFKVLLDGKPNEFIINYFNNNDMPYPDRYREFEKYLRELDNSGSLPMKWKISLKRLMMLKAATGT